MAEATPAPEDDDEAPDRPSAELFDLRTGIGRDLADVDWASTPLGPVASWPASLRNAVRLHLGSRFAMWMAWGPQLTFLCNDAYRRDTLGAKYPWALGRPAGEVWSEIWDDIGPRIRSVMATGEATWDQALLLFLERSGYQEETYHTFSYSPLADDDGATAGMLCVVAEETARVISERRMQVLRDLGAALAVASTVADVNTACERVLERDPRSVPFALAYSIDAAARSGELMWTSRIAAGRDASPVTLSSDSDELWPMRSALAGSGVVVADLADRFADLPRGAWDGVVREALVLPMRGSEEEQPFGVFVAGINPYRELDAGYRGFLELLAGQVASALIRARTFEDERRRAEELAALDRAKTTFFTNVSHELRTPLTLLLGPSSDALADPDHPLPAAQFDRIEVIHRNAERLLKLVNTLLDFSRLQAGHAQARFEPTDLVKYTAELAAMFETAVRRAGLTLEIDDRGPLPPVHVDREMWAKVVFNLLSNALKATFAGEIRVRVSDDGDGAKLTVRDTGIGIPAEELPRLFERFHRVVGADLRSHEGSGIGLALVAELVHAHGGTVAVDSVEGAGTTFTVRLPYGDAHLPADQVLAEPAEEPAEPDRVGAGYLAEAERWLAVASDDAPRTLDLGERARVLVVDDNADMREYVTSLLADDYSVTTAVDGQDGLEVAAASPPDLVLTDVMMPRLDGFGLLAELRRNPATMHVPVVMLSARSGEEAASVGLEAGADDYLVKPFSARELQARVRANLELDRVRRLVDELARNRALLEQAEKLAHVGSWELDVRSGRVTGSEEYLRILDLRPEALHVPNGLDLAVAALHPDDRDKVVASLEATARTGEPFELEARVVEPDGDERLIHARGLLHSGADGRAEYIRGSVQDITEQRRAESALAAAAAAREAAAREHAIAHELQRSLLRTSALDLHGLEVSAYYAAGVQGTQAGGDWYDVIDLGDQRYAFVIGDVMGRGVRAAAVMGQLKATVRSYARIQLDPGDLLTLLDRAVQDLDTGTIVTCVYGVIDLSTGRFTYGNAGHLPPLLARAGEAVRRLDVGGPPLGTGGYRGTSNTVTLAPASTLVLYTDGLVERRDTDLDDGIDELADLLEASSAPVEQLPGEIVGALLPAGPDDDVAILAVTIPADLRGAASWEIRKDPRVVSAIRKDVATLLAEWGVDAETSDDVQLIVSELVTNCIRHAEPPMQCRMRADGERIVIDVTDGTVDPPTPGRFDPAALNSRGLHIVAALSAEWGVRPTGFGKSVWCTVALPPRGSGDEPR